MRLKVLIGSYGGDGDESMVLNIIAEAFNGKLYILGTGNALASEMGSTLRRWKVI